MLHQTATAVLILALTAAGLPVHSQTPDSHLVASILDLDGSRREVGRNMRRGINVALRAIMTANGTPVRITFRSDRFQWQRTIEVLRQLSRAEPVALVGNTGSATTEAALPVLEALGVPLIGPTSGASFLRAQGLPVVNLRPSYKDEASAAVRTLVAGGVEARSVCAVVGGVTVSGGVISGLAETIAELAPDTATATAFEAIHRQVRDTEHLSMAANDSPVAVLDEAHLEFATALRSLERWEAASGENCLALLFTGTPRQAVRLADYLRYRDDDAILVLLSRAHSSQLSADLRLVQADRRVLLAQVMPVDNDAAMVLREAREDLGSEFDRVTLEGYLVGRLFRLMLNRIGEAPVNTQSLLATVLGQEVDLGGLMLDFRDDNQGLDDVTFAALTDAGWHPVTEQTWLSWRQ